MPVVPGVYDTTGPEGFTLPSPSDGSQTSTLISNLVYVSQSTGNDSNPGTLASPVQTLDAAHNGVNKGTQGTGFCKRGGVAVHAPDWILLLEGDTWTDEILANASGGVAGRFPHTGYSKQEPMVITSYHVSGADAANPRGTGTGARVRPKIKGSLSQAQLALGASGCFGSQSNDDYCDNFIMLGIDFHSHKSDPNDPAYDAGFLNTTCIQILKKTSNYIVIEDCKFSFYGTAIYVDGRGDPITITGGISNGSGSAGVILDVTAVPPNFLGLKPPLTAAASLSQAEIGFIGSGVTDNTFLTAYNGSGVGGVGTYEVNNSQLVAPGTTLTIQDRQDRHTFGHQEIIIRRNITNQSYPTSGTALGGFAQGVFVGGFKRLLIEENTFYHDGFCEFPAEGSYIGWPDSSGRYQIQFNHSNYIHEQDNCMTPGEYSETIIRGNNYVKSCAFGAWQRAGGLNENNFYYRCGTAIGMGYEAAIPINPRNVVQRNVVMLSQKFASPDPVESWGIIGKVTASPMVINNNIVAHAHPSATTNWMGISSGYNTEAGGQTPHPRQLSFASNIVVDWPANNGSTSVGTNIIDFSIGAVNSKVGNIEILGGNLSGRGWRDPTRTVLRYDAEVLGGPGTDAHYYNALLSRVGNTWDRNLSASGFNAWMFEGFSLETSILLLGQAIM